MTFLNQLRKIFHWLVVTLLFMVCLGISTQPSFIAGLAPFANLDLIWLTIVLLLYPGPPPLLLIAAAGLLIDTSHQYVLGGSSLLLLLMIPLAKLSLDPAARFSLLKLWLVYLGLLIGYKSGLTAFLMMGDYPVSIPDEVTNGLLSALIFPAFLSLVLWMFRRYSKVMTAR